MRSKIKFFLLAITLSTLITPSVILANESQTEIISKLISSAAQRIGGEKQIGVGSVTMDWSQNPEVKEISALTSDRRIGALMATIDYLDKNEEKIFSNNKTNSNQLAATIITRILSLNYLNTLTTSTENDIVINDYLNSEVADLKLVLSGKINYGSYLQSKVLRDNKRAMLLYTNEAAVEESLKLRAKEGNSAQSLANKTTLISLMETCTESPELCVNAQTAVSP